MEYNYECWSKDLVGQSDRSQSLCTVVVKSQGILATLSWYHRHPPLVLGSIGWNRQRLRNVSELPYETHDKREGQMELPIVLRHDDRRIRKVCS